MRPLIIATFLLSASPAFAYDIKNLSRQDVLTLGEALDAMPHGKVAELYLRIQAQLTAQDAAAAADARAKIEKEVKDKIESESKKDKPYE